ncbi:MAG: hypothetical protein IJO25_05665 [Clostridia bacterium]|nr:hypothetical protein [Clostridia bacterium]
MLDKRTIVLLKIINEKCSKGCYRVIGLDEFLNEFPADFCADEDLIKQSLNSLSLGGYISLRFDRDGQFCLSPTPKGRLFFEEAKRDVLSKKSPITDLLPHFYNFLSTFLAVLAALFIFKLSGGLC